MPASKRSSRFLYATRLGRAHRDRGHRPIKDRTRLSLRLTSILDILFPELLLLFSKPSVLAILELAPEKALELGEEGLLRKASRGKLGRERAQEILAFAVSSVGVRAQLRLLSQQIKALEQDIAALYAKPRAYHARG